MKTKTIVRAVIAAGFIGLVVALCWPSGYMVSRNIGCAEVAAHHDPRGMKICNAISDSMEWTWMGHAIISPGWRVTWDSVRRVYCREKISSSDVDMLEGLKRGSDWRLQSGADDLIKLVTNSTGNGSEPENSIFNPANASYLLKDGCRTYE